MYAVNVEAASTKVYHSAFPLFLELTKNEILFLLFLVTQMDEDNGVRNDQLTRARFNKIAKRRNGKTYSDRTIHRWFQSLADTELVAKRKERSLYQLSPIFFGLHIDKKGGHRAELVRKKLESPLRWEIAKHRATLLSGKAPSESETGSSQTDA